jgi:hypothetical protein
VLQYNRSNKRAATGVKTAFSLEQEQPRAFVADALKWYYFFFS